LPVSYSAWPWRSTRPAGGSHVSAAQGVRAEELTYSEMTRTSAWASAV
jgi:hypothetical protein